MYTETKAFEIPDDSGSPRTKTFVNDYLGFSPTPRSVPSSAGPGGSAGCHGGRATLWPGSRRAARCTWPALTHPLPQRSVSCGRRLDRSGHPGRQPNQSRLLQ